MSEADVKIDYEVKNTIGPVHQSFDFTMHEVNPEAMKLFMGFDAGSDVEPTFAIVVKTVVPAPPPMKPIKGRYPWGVGKAYRRSRREYARQLRAHKKAGGTVTRTIYLPDVALTVDRISDSLTTVSFAAEQASKAMESFGKQIDRPNPEEN